MKQKPPSVRRGSPRLYTIITSLVLLGLLAACGPTVTKSPTPIPGKLGEILQRGTLVIATDPEYPPQSEVLPDAPRAAQTRCAPNEMTANQLKGFDVDVAVEIARRLGVEACFVVPPWSQIVGGSWNDRWDISVGSMAITTERMQVLYFSQPYTTGAAVIFVHKDNQDYQKPGDLSGKRVGVCAGCAYEFYLQGSLVIPGRQIEYQIKDPVTVGYDTDMTALQDLAQGDGANLDAVITDPDTGQIAIDEGLPIKQLGEPIYYDYVAAAVDKKGSKDAASFMLRVTEIIQQMHQDGALLKLSMQYYGGDFTSEASRFDFSALNQFPSP
jgi:polar amino acid transport system substrate-binding protein